MSNPNKRGRPSRGITETNLRLYAPKALMDAMREAAKSQRISLAEAWRRAARDWLVDHLPMAGVLVAIVLASSCGAPFVPAYPGEPECGRPTAIHATRGEPCSGVIQVACECSDRDTLECKGGVWVWSHFFCHDGLNVSTPQ